jgi:hypothetical protein
MGGQNQNIYLPSDRREQIHTHPGNSRAPKHHSVTIATPFNPPSKTRNSRDPFWTSRRSLTAANNFDTTSFNRLAAMKVPFERGGNCKSNSRPFGNSGGFMLHKDIQGSHRVASQTQVAQQVEEQHQLPHPVGFYLSRGGEQKVLSHYCPNCRVDTKIFGTFENRSVRHCNRVDGFKNSFLRRLFLPAQWVVTKKQPMVSCV